VRFSVGVLLTAALCTFATPGYCQDFPKATLFTGYSYMHGLPTDETVSLHGWAAGFEYNLSRRFGLAANVTGDYGASSAIVGTFLFGTLGYSLVSGPTFSTGITKLSVVKHSVLLGPELRLSPQKRTTVTMMAGIGAARYTLDSQGFIFFSTSGSDTPHLPASNAFAAGGGVSVDIRLTRRVSYRLIQSRFIAANLDAGWQRSIQLATGLVVDLLK
jgi:hypothetical protein